MFKNSEFQSCFSFWIKPESAWFNVLPIPMWCALCIHRRKDIYCKRTQKRKETPIWDGNVWMKELSEWIRLILFHLVDFENVIVWKSLYVRLQSLFWIIQGSMWNHFIVMTSYSPPLCLCLQIYMHDHSVRRIPWWKMYLFNEKKHAYKQTLISKVLTTLIHLVSYLS